MKDLARIRRENLEQLISCLRTGPKTKLELKEASGISLMSVTNLTRQLLEHNIVELAQWDKEHDSKGRRAELVRLKTDEIVWPVLDLRNYSLELLVFDRARCEVSRYTGFSKDNYIQGLTGFLHQAKLRTENYDIRGVSVITPGPYNPDTDRVVNLRIKELNTIPLKQLIKQETGMDCYIEEDVKLSAAALWEQTDSPSLFYLYIGSGVGGALINEGHVLRGLNSMAGDPGQLPYGDTVYEEVLKSETFYSEAATGSYEELIRQKAAVTADMLQYVIWMTDPHSIVIRCPYARDYAEEFAGIISGRLQNSLRQPPRIIMDTQRTDPAYTGAVKAAERIELNRICNNE